MNIKFVPASDNVITNNDVLSSGVVGIKVTGVRRPTSGELLDYLPFAPFDCFLSSVENYANGAQNFFVRDIEEGRMVGYITIRRNNNP